MCIMENVACRAALLLAVGCFLSCSHAGRGEACGTDAAPQGREAESKGACADGKEMADCIPAGEFLRRFILSYEQAPDASLLDSCLTPHAREMYGRMVMEHGCDMLVLAQDVPDDFEETLAVTALGHGWYRMEYEDPWRGGKVSNYFFVTGEGQDGRCRIAYVHGFAGELAADSIDASNLFWVKRGGVPVGGGTALEFLRSFYRAYAAEYLSLDADVARGTGMLRERYLSAEARNQCEALGKEYAEDGMDGYDALIGGFYTTMKREQERDIREAGAGLLTVDGRLEISVGHASGRWLIAGVREIRPEGKGVQGDACGR